MVKRAGPEDLDVVIKFGAGLHTRAPEDEIGEREAADGFNFLIDVQNSDLRPRPPFDLLGTAPNGGSILGGGSFRLSGGNVKAFVQAGTTVYEWDGDSFIASPVLDTVASGTKLRGHWRSHSWDLDGKLLISDLALLEVVKEWNGTTWQDIAFRSGPSTSFGTFYCKYISINDERVMYSNVRDPGGTFRHMMVGSQRSDYQEISVSNRPSTSLSEADPFFLLTPDLRAINGFVQAFGTVVLSTQYGRLFNLTGASAKDFAFSEFYPGSAASGEESLAYIGNDIIYGRPGRIESVVDTDRFGDSAADDLTIGIADEVKGYTGWKTVYNSRLNRVYLFPESVSEVWVFDTAMKGGETSPWMRWRTSHPMAFQPTFVQSMLDPLDGLEYVFLGDSSGNFYRLEGTGENGDGGRAVQLISGGTNIGNMSAGGGLAAAFDGDTTQVLTASAEKTTSTDAYVGKTFAAPTQIDKVEVYGSDDQGFVVGAANVTLQLRGKTGAAPASSSDGTLLGTATFPDSLNEIRTILSSDNVTRFNHAWIRVTHDAAAANMAVAELSIFEQPVPISTSWTSKLFSLPLNARVHRLGGYIKYRRGELAQITIELLYAGENVFDEAITVQIPSGASLGGGFYNANYYYSNGVYYGSVLIDRMVRQRIEIAGGDANEFQVRISASETTSFDINEIGLRFIGASN